MGHTMARKVQKTMETNIDRQCRDRSNKKEENNMGFIAVKSDFMCLMEKYKETYITNKRGIPYIIPLLSQRIFYLRLSLLVHSRR